MRITDKKQIEQKLNDYIFRFGEQKPKFIPLIFIKRNGTFAGKVYKGGIFLEGCRPISRTIDCQNNKIIYSVANSDSNYQFSIGQFELSDVEFLEFF